MVPLLKTGRDLPNATKCSPTGSKDDEHLYENSWLDARAVPEIILGGGVSHIFFRPLHPQDTQGVRAPRPPGHINALIKPPHCGSNMPWPPGQVTPPPPTPRTHCQQNTLPPPDKKVFAAPPPQDNFWNSPHYQGKVFPFSHLSHLLKVVLPGMRGRLDRQKLTKTSTENMLCRIANGQKTASYQSSLTGV